MALKTRNGDLSYARFTDDACTLIRAEYRRDDGSIFTEHHTYNPDDEMVAKILAEFSAEDLEREYTEWNKREVTTAQYFQYFQQHAERICEIIDNKIHFDEPQEKALSLLNIKEVGNNPEEFFKLKLEIFELEEVKGSKNRQWKAAMRKASTSLELLSLLYEVYSTLENEEGERQD